MSTSPNVSRRRIPQAWRAGTGGLLIGFRPPTRAETAAMAAAAPLKLNAWVHVGTDDIVTLFIHKAEMGQGTVTSLSMLLAEELECDWKKIRTEFPGVDREYGAMQGVFGSQSIRSSWIRCGRPAPRRARCSCRRRRSDGRRRRGVPRRRTARSSTPRRTRG